MQMLKFSTEQDESYNHIGAIMVKGRDSENKKILVRGLMWYV